MNNLCIESELYGIEKLTPRGISRGAMNQKKSFKKPSGLISGKTPSHGIQFGASAATGSLSKING